MKNILTQSLAKYFLPENNTGPNINNLCKGVKSTNMLNATRSGNKLISHFFSPINTLRSNPVYSVTPNAVIVHVSYYMPVFNESVNNNTVNNLGEALSSLFERPVELRLIRQYYPYLNSYILAQYIARNTQDYTLVQIVREIFGDYSPVKNIKSLNTLSSKLPSHIVGIKVRVSGRLMMERSRPRQTVQTVQVGSFAKNNLAVIDTARFTTKNKKNAFTVKVWMMHRTAI